MTENFKDHPVSIAERKSDKSMNAADWTPRDALINMLRRIDGGEKINEMVICYALREGNAATPGFMAATSNPLCSVGLVCQVQNMLNSKS